MTEMEFIARSVVLQTHPEGLSLSQTDDALERALRGSSMSAFAYFPDQDKVLSRSKDGASLTSQNRDFARLGPKAKGALDSVLAHGPTFRFIVDMQDRRIRSLAEPGEPTYPVFCFNRIAGDRQRILWPLAEYHDLNGDHFVGGLDPDDAPFDKKKNMVVWRGITGGRTRGEAPGRGEGIRLKAALKRHRAGRMSPEALSAAIRGLPRFNAVQRLKDDPRFDFGFVDGDGYVIAETEMHEHLSRPRMTRKEMQTYKYIAVLRGLDVGSAFYWVMNSGSVGMVMETPFETFASGHFLPWTHFIPFREDLSDLHENLDWAEAHPDECQKMTFSAAGICRLLSRRDLRDAIQNEIIGKLNDLAKR